MLVACLIGFLSNAIAAKTKKIVIESDVFAKKKSISLFAIPVSLYNFIEDEDYGKYTQTYTAREGRVKIDLTTSEPMYLVSKDLFNSVMVLAEPGDIIDCRLKNGKLNISGNSSEKYLMFLKLGKMRAIPDQAFKILPSTSGIKEFLEWYHQGNKLIDERLSVLNASKNKISKVCYEILQSEIISSTEKKAIDYFNSIIRSARVRNTSLDSLNLLYDSTLANSKFFKLNLYKSDNASQARDIDGYLMSFLELKKIREKNFEPLPVDKNKLTGLSRSSLIGTHYYYQKRFLYGLARITALKKLIQPAIVHLGLNDTLQTLLDDYYSLPGYSEFKKRMSDFVLKRESLSAGAVAPNFSLADVNGKKISLLDFKGKLVFIDFWFTGCKGCVTLSKTISKIEKEFVGDTTIVFVSISVDKNEQQWLNSIETKKYTSGKGIALFTEGEGVEHRTIKDYNVNAYPSTYMIDGNGKFLDAPFAGSGEGKELINFIKRIQASKFDGPYVSFKGDSILTNSFYPRGSELKIENKTYSSRHGIVKGFKVHTDIYPNTFPVKLKDSIITERSSYSDASKILAISDIEGNFDAFRKLLQANNVIDSSLNWIYGNGHLVLIGDFVDRGNQVTELLWLIYSLEQQAQIFKGHVHFILGNHEIMNLSGDLRYLNEKYSINSKMANVNYSKFFLGANSELGKWMRSKNIIEKINNLLFTHAGIGEEVNDLGLSIYQINKTAREYYDDAEGSKLTDTKLKTLYSSNTSPFWNRAYYFTAPFKVRGYSDGRRDTIYKISNAIVDETCRIFDVKHIITGHTVVDPGEHVSVHYNNKVINTDTEHAKGKSEALLVEGNSYYRVNDKGQRFLLFKDE